MISINLLIFELLGVMIFEPRQTLMTQKVCKI